MKATQWIRLIAAPLALVLIGLCHVARAQDVLLAGWDNGPTGAVFPGGDFDPTLDNMATCSGCWYSRTGTTGVTYSQSTTNGVTQGTGALQATLIGKGNGGEYTPIINGVPVTLDTHFDYPLVTTYSNNPAANGGVLDPRFTAIKEAVDGNQGLFSIEFDITYDVAQMRSIPWQPPEETVDPETNGRFPHRFFWIGMYGNAAEDGGFQFTGFDANTINPFDSQWDNNLLPVFQASFPLTDFTFQPDSATTFYSFGFLYNSVFGTSPASSNTEGVNIYFDNFRLVERDVLGPIDFNDNGMADLGDFELFMAQHLVATPTVGDFDGDGDNDFIDFQQFEEFYDLASGGTGALAAALGAVPEPGTVALAGIALLGLLFGRGRRWGRPVMALAAAGIVVALTQQPAQAQLVESFETIGNWQANAGAPAPSNPSVALSTTGATQGATSLKVTQAEDTLGNDDFIWAATTVPNWTDGDTAFEVLREAVNIGAEHFNLLVDTTFNVDDLPAVNSMTVTLGLNFVGQNAGFYDASAPPAGPITTTIPLSAFNLPDVEDEGATSYSAQIGFTADAFTVPFSAYIDNIRLEQISTPDLLTLEIDRSNGAATLRNLTANPIAWDYMEIKSEAGSLDPAGWNSLDDQNADGAGTWIEAGGSSTSELVEASLLGSHTLMPGMTLALGNLYNESLNAEDVDLEIRRASGPSFRTFDQLVTYVGIAPVGVAGDYNENGVVDAADYTVWRDLFGANVALPNEVPGTSPGVVDQADYTAWKARFGNSGSGGGAGLQSAAVPEPSFAVFMIAAMVAGVGGRSRGVSSR